MTPYPAAPAGRGLWPTWTTWALATIPAVVLACLAYAGTLGYPWVFDDFSTVVENEQIKYWDQPWQIFMGSGPRPVFYGSLAVNWALHGRDPFFYRVVNLAIHVLCIGLAAWLAHWAAAALGKPTRADAPPVNAQGFTLIVTALFALHPLQVQAVPYVAQRSEILSSLFYLAAVLAFIRYRHALGRWRHLWLAGSFAAFGVAAGAKELAGTIPFLLLWLDATHFRPEPAALQRAPMGARVRGFLVRHAALLPWFALIFAGVIYRLHRLQAEVITSPLPRSVLSNLMTQANVLFLGYLRLFAVPMGLNVAHHFPPVENLWQGATYTFIMAIGALGLAAVAWRRAAPLAAFAIVWFFLAIAPSSSFIPLQETMAEHRMYLPLLGPAMLIAFGLDRLAARWPSARRALGLDAKVAAFAIAAAIGLTLLTAGRTKVWASDLALWGDAVAREPNYWGSWYAYGDALRNSGDNEGAIKAYQKTLEYNPGYPDALINLGICHANLQHIDQACASFQSAYEAVTEALKPNPRRGDYLETKWKALNNLGRCALLKGRHDEMKTLFGEVLKENPAHCVARKTLGSYYREIEKNPAVALEHFVACSAHVPATHPDKPDLERIIAELRRELGQ